MGIVPSNVSIQQYVTNYTRNETKSIHFRLHWLPVGALLNKQKKNKKNEVCLFEIELEDLNAHFQTLYHSFIFNLSFFQVWL